MLSEQVLQQIEKAIGINDLASMISSEEVIDNLEFGKTKHFSESEHRQLITNVSNDVPKEKWEEAKVAGIEMAIKKLKETKGWDFQGKSLESLTEYYDKQLEANKIDNDSELKSKYESEINELKKVISKYKGEIEQVNLNSKKEKINNTIDSYFNSLDVFVPDGIEDKDGYIRMQRNKEKTFFKSQYDFDIDEHGIITTSKDGNILKDETLSPIKVDNLVKDYVSKSIVQVEQKSKKGRGEGDRLPSTSLTNIKSQDDLDKYAKEKGIVKNTAEYDAIYLEYKKNN